MNVVHCVSYKTFQNMAKASSHQEAWQIAIEADAIGAIAAMHSFDHADVNSSRYYFQDRKGGRTIFKPHYMASLYEEALENIQAVWSLMKNPPKIGRTHTLKYGENGPVWVELGRRGEKADITITVCNSIDALRRKIVADWAAESDAW